MAQARTYIPPLRYRVLTRLYDPVVRVTTRENTIKRALIDQLDPRAGEAVLDLGCGTATLAIAIAARCPGAHIVGVDADPEALAIARGKAARTGVAIRLERGFAQELPFAEATFQRVASSLFFHHLDREAKRQAFGEVRRVLAPGGELHVADWGEARNALERLLFISIQLLDGFSSTRDNIEGRLPIMMKGAGFEHVRETKRFLTVFGALSLYSGRQPT